MLSITFLLSFLFFLLLFFQVKLPFIPFDNTNKIQSLNNQKIQLSLFLISLPIILFYSNLLEFILYLLAFTIGILDDKYSLNVKSRFFSLFFFLFLYLLVSKNFIYFSFYSESFLFIFKILITIFFILGFIHTINMIDGRNGFVLIIYSNILFFLILKLDLYNVLESEIIYLFVVLLLSFFINVLNKSYLGNSGVIILTIYFSFLLIELFNDSTINIKDIYTVLFLPFLDGLRVTIIRLFQKKNVFLADRNHIHHQIKRWDIGLTAIFFVLIIMNSINLYLNISLLSTVLVSLFIYGFLFYFFKKW